MKRESINLSMASFGDDDLLKLIQSIRISDACLSLGLDSKMKKCLCLHIASQYYSSRFLKDQSIALLNDISYNHSFAFKSQLAFENGLSGIAWGLTYFIRQGQTTPNIRQMLSDLDDFIFKRLSSVPIEELFQAWPVLNILIYVIERFKLGFEHAKEARLQQKYIIYLINAIDFADKRHASGSIWDEPDRFDVMYLLPIYLYLISELYKLNLYTDKLNRIICDLTPVIHRTWPLCESHKIYLLIMYYRLSQIKDVPQWRDHLQILANHFNLTKLKTEFKYKAIDLQNGVSGLLLVMNLFHTTGSLPAESVCTMAVEHLVRYINTTAHLSQQEVCDIAISLLIHKQNQSWRNTICQTPHF